MCAGIAALNLCLDASTSLTLFVLTAFVVAVLNPPKSHTLEDKSDGVSAKVAGPSERPMTENPRRFVAPSQPQQKVIHGNMPRTNESHTKLLKKLKEEMLTAPRQYDDARVQSKRTDE